MPEEKGLNRGGTGGQEAEFDQKSPSPDEKPGPGQQEKGVRGRRPAPSSEPGRARRGQGGERKLEDLEDPHATD